jgi:Tfp pilus assembly protein PilF
MIIPLPLVPLLQNSSSNDQLSAYLNNFGFVALKGVTLTEDWLIALKQEAENQRQMGWHKPFAVAVNHSVLRAQLGATAAHFVDHIEIINLIQNITGYSIKFSPAASCYTYYQGPGDYLELHLDRDQDCAVTLLLYLEAQWPPNQQPSQGLELQVFPNFSTTSGDIPPPSLCIPSRENTLVLGYGSSTPHRRSQLKSGESVIVLSVCFAILPQDQSKNIQRDFQKLLAQGHQHWLENNFDLAKISFENAKAIDSGSDEAWQGLGFVLWSQHSFAEALSAFQQAVITNAGVAAHWSNIGLCLRDLKHYDQAINAFSAALLIDPNFAPAWNEWGNVLQDLGRYHEALEYYHKSLTIDQQRAVVHHNLGVAYSRLDQTELAVAAFQVALVQDTEYSHSLEEMGIVMRDKGDFIQAQDYFDRAGSNRAQALAKTLDDYTL